MDVRGEAVVTSATASLLAVLRQALSLWMWTPTAWRGFRLTGREIKRDGERRDEDLYAIYKNTGAQIRGTLERLHGRAEAAEDSFRRDADGSIEFDYDGETEIYWDDGITVQREGQTVYIDEHGTEVTQGDIVLVEHLPGSGE